jgi:hypothetical protein
MLLSGVAAVLVLAVFVYFLSRGKSPVIDAVLAMLLMAAWWIGQFNHLTTLWLPGGG